MKETVEILLLPEAGWTTEELKHRLETNADWDPSIRLDIRRPPESLLGPGLDFIRATLPYATAALVAFIKAVTDVRKAKNLTEVTIKFPDGTEWRLKGSLAVKKAEQLLMKLKPNTIVKV